MQLRSLLQLAAVTAGALARAREGPGAVSDATQTALQEEFQLTMEAFREYTINGYLASEDLALAAVAGVANVIGQAGQADAAQGGGRRGRRTRHSKPRSRGPRGRNKRKTRVRKARRTRRR